MLVVKIAFNNINKNSKNNISKNKNNKACSQLNIDNTSFKSVTKCNLAYFASTDAKSLLKSLEPPKYAGDTPEAQVEDMTKIILERYPNSGQGFKNSINSVLEYLASKGIVIDAQPYKSRFDSVIVVKDDARSHLAQTWRDAHKLDLEFDQASSLTPNSARVGAIDNMRSHILNYRPSLFDEDAAARESEVNFNKYKPRVPKNILEMMTDLQRLKTRLHSGINTIKYANLDLYSSALTKLMPDDGVLGSEDLLKVAEVADDYKPEYAKPFDWEHHRRMTKKQFEV